MESWSVVNGAAQPKDDRPNFVVSGDLFLLFVRGPSSEHSFLIPQGNRRCALSLAALLEGGGGTNADMARRMVRAFE